MFVVDAISDDVVETGISLALRVIFPPLGPREDYEHWYSLRCFDCLVVNVFRV